MIKILFVCHGNICRSPMAEYVMKNIIKNNDLDKEIYIESAATSTEAIGRGIYSPARELLELNGIDCSDKISRQIIKDDYERFDMLVGMDNDNIRNMINFFEDDKKLSMLLDYTDRPGEVADPWYTRDFKATWDDVEEGCKGLLKYIEKNRIIG